MSTISLVLGGVKSFLPIQAKYSMRSSAVDARYGYAVWLRHVEAISAYGLRGPFHSVVELGPGNSVATGVCAVLSGASTYAGIDVLDHLARDEAQRVFREILDLFDEQAPIPGESEYPNLCPRLSSLAFPGGALESFGFGVADIRRNLRTLHEDIDGIAGGVSLGRHLRYVTSWKPTSVDSGSADLIFSQAVLEEIPHLSVDSPLRSAFETMMDWLRPGGIASHQIDLGMYGHTPWNIHWTWNDLTWKVIRGRRDNFVNREPLSTYLMLAESVGLEIVSVGITEAKGVDEGRLHPKFRRLLADDKRASGAHLLLRKPQAS